MQIQKLHPNCMEPERSSAGAGGYDLFMPEAGHVPFDTEVRMVGLGFAAAVPVGWVALILPRSGAGANRGVALRNTCGVIDSDYRGEWKVAVSQRENSSLSWEAGDRLFQFILVPVGSPPLQWVPELPPSERGESGFGSTGQ